jgi:ribosomal protein S18 acetylase RimI-like enzyme
MDIVIRRGEVEDAAQCTTIFYEAFKANAERHNFPNEIAPPDSRTVSSWAKRFSHPGYYGVVAELDGRIVGSNFLDERDPIAGVGPLTVDPLAQDNGVGQRLMEEVLLHSAEKRHPGVRLVQAAYNRRSLVLYTKLGFQVREMLVSMQGPPLRLQIPGHNVRPATKADLDFCNHLCKRVHGHARGAVLLEAIEQGTASVVEREDRITGYTTGIGFSGHAVGESNSDLKALIGAAPEYAGIAGFLLPTRNGELFRWCLQNGLKVVLPLTLMSLGLYNESSGSFLPSIYY